ncbi:MAG TPA: GNAT family N-acetyltransferase [Bryobacteraceae bacterium]
MDTASAPAFLRERIEIREASETDNEALLALTRATPMDGTISLRIDRDPDFFALLRLRGASRVFMAARGREVVGCISAALRTVYVGAVPETIAYVGDMKVHPKFSGSRVAVRVIQALEADLRANGIDVCVSVAAEGNRRAMPLFEGRLGLPRWTTLGRFLVDQLLPTPFQGRSKHYRIETAQPADLAAIAALLDRFHRSRQFAPQLADIEIADTLSAGGTFVARHGRQIVATLTVSDMGPMKRNVLLDAPAVMKGSLALLRFGTAPLPGFVVPPLRGFIVPKFGDALRLLSVRHAACDAGHQAALAALLRRARVETLRRRFTCLAVGLHEHDPLRSLVRGIPRFTFTSLAFVTSLGSSGRLKELTQGIPFEDYALV